MSENKTKPTSQSIADFLSNIENEATRDDCIKLVEIMKAETGEEPQVWGSMVGFGKYHYKYDSGREGDSFLTGFSPRKQNLTLYIMAGFNYYPELMQKLGKHKTGKGCLYLKSLNDVDEKVLRELIKRSAEHMRSGGKSNF